MDSNKLVKYDISNIFKFSVEKYRNRIALVDSYGKLTYGEVDKYSESVASCLIKIPGWKTGSTVAIDLKKSREAIILILAIYKAGGIYLPLNKSYPINRSLYMINEGNGNILISDDSDKLNEFRAYINNNHKKYEKIQNINLISLDALMNKVDIFNDNELLNIEKSKIAYIMFTSGSTGDPKGVVVSQRSVINSICACYSRFLELPEGMDFLSYLQYEKEPLRIGVLADFSFDPSVVQMFIALFFGHCIVPIPDEVKKSQRRLSEYFKEKEVDMCDITPTHMKHLLRFYEKQPQNLYLPSKIVSVGEPLKSELVKSIFSFPEEGSRKIINAYGPTEICVYSNAKIFTNEDVNDISNKNHLSIGKPLSGYKVYILDNDKKPVKKGEEGEIYIGGQFLSEGYIGRMELTNKAFISDIENKACKMYKTGDIGKEIDGDEFICIGRNDDQVKITGHRIELREIEKVLINTDFVEEAYIMVDDSDENNIVIVAFYTGVESEENKLKEKLVQYLPEYMIPKYFIYIDKFKVNANGKIDRKFLLESYNNIKYRFEVEDKDLLDICRDLLKNNRLKYEDNFFECGATSLEVFILNTKVYNKWGISLDNMQLYKLKNIGAMRELINYELSTIKDEKKCEKLLCNVKEIVKIPATEFQCRIVRSEKKLLRSKSNVKNSIVPPFNIIRKIEHSNYIDSKRFKKAIEMLVDRNRVLRSYFQVENKHLYFTSSNEVKIDFSIVYTEEIHNINIFYKQAKNFICDSLPLFQIVLFENSIGEQTIMLNIHHTIFDYLSLPIFLNELFALYYDIPLQDKNYDFFKYVQEDMNNDKSHLHNFWKNYLKNRPVAVGFISDKGKNGLKVNSRDKFKFVKAEFKEEDTKSLINICKKLNITVFTFISSALAEVLKDYTGEKDISIGTVLHGRAWNCAGISEVIGMLAEVFPLRITIKEKEDLSERLVNEQNNMNELLRCQGITMNDIYCMQSFEERLKGEFFKVILNYHIDYYTNLPNDLGVIKSIDVSEYPEIGPFYIQVTSHRNSITFSVMYAEKLYTEEYVKKIVDNYISCIKLWIQKISIVD